MRPRARSAGFALALVLIALTAAAGPPELTPRELAARLTSDNPPVVLDVRSDDEWAAGHIPGAIHIPHDQIQARRDEVPTDREVVVHCGIAPRARIAEAVLIESGHQQVWHLTGGFIAWKNDGRAIEAPPSP